MIEIKCISDTHDDFWQECLEIPRKGDFITIIDRSDFYTRNQFEVLAVTHDFSDRHEDKSYGIIINCAHNATWE